jgi:flagellar M-ring protein FliF
MNEWLRRVLDQIKALWGRWTTTQRLIFFTIIGGALVGILLLVVFSSAPSMVPLFTTPVTDQNLRQQISLKLDEQGVSHSVSTAGVIYVKDEETARRMRAILVRDDLVPKNVSPWAVFQMNQWTTTDFERNVNLREAITKALQQHIEALQDVDSAKVQLVLPQNTLFKEDQLPVTASIIITPSPGSDITTNVKKIQGIQKLVKLAVPGLQDSNIVITDEYGNVLNDFTNLADVTRLDLAKAQIQEKLRLENQYRQAIEASLGQIFSPDRVRVMKVDISLNMAQKTIDTKEHFPITIVAQNPNVPYDTSKVVESIAVSKQTKNESFQGTGFNPEGPPGQEGQTPPAYKDLSNLVGKYSNNTETTNYELNTRNIHEIGAPYTIDRVSVGVAIDGTWEKVYDAKGDMQFNPDGSIMRKYTPVSDADLKKATALVEDAIGYNVSRGDSVSVESIQFDRSQQFAKEDQKIRDQRRLQQAVIYSLLGLAAVLVAFIVFRLISREMERRRRLREEELSRQHQAMREAALRSAEEEGVEVQMSVEERARLEMQENAINMAREHPEDVAQLIRTWLVEE